MICLPQRNKHLFYYFSNMVGDRQVTTTTTFECCAGYENSFKGTCEKVSKKMMNTASNIIIFIHIIIMFYEKNIC